MVVMVRVELPKRDLEILRKRLGAADRRTVRKWVVALVGGAIVDHDSNDEDTGGS